MQDFESYSGYPVYPESTPGILKKPPVKKKAPAKKKTAEAYLEKLKEPYIPEEHYVQEEEEEPVRAPKRTKRVQRGAKVSGGAVDWEGRIDRLRDFDYWAKAHREAMVRSIRERQTPDLVESNSPLFEVPHYEPRQARPAGKPLGRGRGRGKGDLRL